MDLEDLKSENLNDGNTTFSKENLQRMKHVNGHPVLKGIKTKLILESVFWISFLVVYYDFFDGHLKPLLWNVLLIVSVGPLLAHNVLLFYITKNPINGENICTSFKHYLKRLRKNSIISIGTRVLAILIIFGYFLSSISVFESRHYVSLFFLLLIIVIQVYVLHKIWVKRISKVASVYEQFS
ncbi:MAG: hypothetical protein AAGI07_04595 [Bacteroidota bacterium]